MSWLQIKKNPCFEVSSSLSPHDESFLNQIATCDEKWILYDNQLSGWMEKKLQSTSQSQTCTKERSWSLFGGLLCVWPTIAFWIPAKSWHLRSKLSKSMICTENWNACSRQWSTESPILLYHNAWPQGAQPMLQKLNTLGYKVLPLMSYSPDLSPTDNYFFKHLDKSFARKTLPQPTGCRKCFPRVHWILKHGFLCDRNKQTYVLLAKRCLL